MSISSDFGRFMREKAEFCKRESEAFYGSTEPYHSPVKQALLRALHDREQEFLTRHQRARTHFDTHFDEVMA
jgi:hypothetical protein